MTNTSSPGFAENVPRGCRGLQLGRKVSSLLETDLSGQQLDAQKSPGPLSFYRKVPWSSTQHLQSESKETGFCSNIISQSLGL